MIPLLLLMLIMLSAYPTGDANEVADSFGSARLFEHHTSVVNSARKSVDPITSTAHNFISNNTLLYAWQASTNHPNIKINGPTKHHLNQINSTHGTENGGRFLSREDTLSSTENSERLDKRSRTDDSENSSQLVEQSTESLASTLWPSVNIEDYFVWMTPLSVTGEPPSVDNDRIWLLTKTLTHTVVVPHTSQLAQSHSRQSGKWASTEDASSKTYVSTWNHSESSTASMSGVPSSNMSQTGESVADKNNSSKCSSSGDISAELCETFSTSKTSIQPTSVQDNLSEIYPTKPSPDYQSPLLTTDNKSRVEARNESQFATQEINRPTISVNVSNHKIAPTPTPIMHNSSITLSGSDKIVNDSIPEAASTDKAVFVSRRKQTATRSNGTNEEQWHLSSITAASQSPESPGSTITTESLATGDKSIHVSTNSAAHPVVMEGSFLSPSGATISTIQTAKLPNSVTNDITMLLSSSATTSLATGRRGLNTLAGTFLNCSTPNNNCFINKSGLHQHVWSVNALNTLSPTPNLTFDTISPGKTSTVQPNTTQKGITHNITEHPISSIHPIHQANDSTDTTRKDATNTTVRRHQIDSTKAPRKCSSCIHDSKKPSEHKPNSFTTPSNVPEPQFWLVSRFHRVPKKNETDLRDHFEHQLDTLFNRALTESFNKSVNGRSEGPVWRTHVLNVARDGNETQRAVFIILHEDKPVPPSSVMQVYQQATASIITENQRPDIIDNILPYEQASSEATPSSVYWTAVVSLSVLVGLLFMCLLATCLCKCGTSAATAGTHDSQSSGSVQVDRRDESSHGVRGVYNHAFDHYDTECKGSIFEPSLKMPANPLAVRETGITYSRDTTDATVLDGSTAGVHTKQVITGTRAVRIPDDKLPLRRRSSLPTSCLLRPEAKPAGMESIQVDTVSSDHVPVQLCAAAVPAAIEQDEKDEQDAELAAVLECLDAAIQTSPPRSRKYVEDIQLRFERSRPEPAEEGSDCESGEVSEEILVMRRRFHRLIETAIETLDSEDFDVALRHHSIRPSNGRSPREERDQHSHPEEVDQTSAGSCADKIGPPKPVKQAEMISQDVPGRDRQTEVCSAVPEANRPGLMTSIFPEHYSCWSPSTTAVSRSIQVTRPSSDQIGTGYTSELYPDTTTSLQEEGEDPAVAVIRSIKAELQKLDIAASADSSNV